jgi:hypothetical protein
MKEYHYDITVHYGGLDGNRLSMRSDTYSVIAIDEDTAKVDLLEYLDDDRYEISKVICTGEVEQED